MTVIFDFIKQVLALPFSFILGLFYNLTDNYIWAIVLLTILVKCCFLPSAIKQQKASAKTAAYNEKVKLLKTQYADDTETLDEKLNELKKHEPDKKLNIGCLSTIVQLIVMIGLLGVIYTPLTNVLHVQPNTITEMKAIMAPALEEHGDAMPEIVLLKEAENYKAELLSDNILTEAELSDIITFKNKYNFFGIDLSGNPELTNINKLWLIPVLVFLTGMMLPLYSFIKRKIKYPTKAKFSAIEAVPFISPMMIFLFAFMFSAGVGLYWAISNLLSFIQTITLNVIFNPQKESICMDTTAEDAPAAETKAAVEAEPTVEPEPMQ